MSYIAIRLFKRRQSEIISFCRPNDYLITVLVSLFDSTLRYFRLFCNGVTPKNNIIEGIVAKEPNDLVLYKNLRRFVYFRRSTSFTEIVEAEELRKTN